MFAFFSAPENLPFAVALGLFFIVGVLQTASLLTGISLFDWIDHSLPDFDSYAQIGGANVEVAPDLVADGANKFTWIAQAFAWMNFGRVPFVVGFLWFLFLFACIGFNAQLALAASGIGALPAILMAPLVFTVTIFPLRWGNALLGKIMPHDETSAVSNSSYIGRTATITIGCATHERHAEARVRDAHGRTRHLMVRADRPGESFAQGEHVLIVSEAKGMFTVIAVSNPHLDSD